MKRNIGIFLYLLKERLRDRGAFFWTMLYPVILVSIFYFGFSGLMDQKFEPIEVGIDPDYKYIRIFEMVDILKTQAMEKEQGEEMLRKEEIAAYIREDGELILLKSGISQTLVKEVTDWIAQVHALMESGASIENLRMDRMHVKTLQQSEDFWKLTYYSTVAMCSVYSMYGGIALSTPNPTSARIAVSPLKKSTRIIFFFLLSTFINLLVNIFLVFYIDYILKLDLFPKLWQSFVLISCGSLFGIALGILIGLPRKLSDGAKIGIATSISGFAAFFAGMTGREIPRLLSRTMPGVEKLNPIAVISNNLMRVNMLDSTNTYMQGIAILLLQTAIFLIAGLVLLKSRKCECD